METRNNTTKREISTETSKLIDSFDNIMAAHSLCLQYFHSVYGEDTPLWDDSDVKKDFENIERSMKLLIGDSIELNLSDFTKKHI